MNLLNISRQRVAGIIAVLLLTLLLMACGTPANAADSGGSQGTSAQQTQKTQQRQPTSSNTGSATNGGIRGTDQQVQSLLRQLDGAQIDVNNADAGASQDNGQP